MSTLTISARAVGKRKPLVPDWQIPWNDDAAGRSEPTTLRQVITTIVLKEVALFKGRQAARGVVRILTERQMEDGIKKGRVDSGGRDLRQADIDEEAAIGAALQAFEDGLYLVIFDGEEQDDLDKEIQLQAESSLVFLRLVLLAGA